MQFVANAMTYQLPNNTKLIGSKGPLNGRRDITHPASMPYYLQGIIKRMFRALNKTSRVGVRFTDTNRYTRISNHAFIPDTKVIINHIPFFEWPVIRNAVLHLVVHRNTDGIRVTKEV